MRLTGHHLKITFAVLTLSITYQTCSGAIVQVFTSRAEWETNAGTHLTEDFESVPLGFPQGDINNSFGLVDFFYDGPPSFFGPEIVDDGIIDGSRELEGHVGTPGQSSFDFPEINRFLFPFPTKAWGADFNNTIEGDRLGVTVLGEVINFEDHVGNDTVFLGVVSDLPFTEITFSSLDLGPPNAVGVLYRMDNLSFATAVPEPSHLIVLCAAAMVCFARLRWHVGKYKLGGRRLERPALSRPMAA